MRRSIIALMVGALISMGTGIAPTGADARLADTTTTDPAASATTAPGPPDGNCYSIPTPGGASLDLCDHGPDVPIDLPLGRPLDSYAQYSPPLVPQETAGIKCYGDGTSGIRVQPVYVRPPGVIPPGGIDARLAQIMTYAAQVESEVSASAQQTGGERHVRWVTNESCDLQILQVELTTTATATDVKSTPSPFQLNQAEMVTKGHYRSDRIYLMWTESSVYCGIGNLIRIDTPSSMNPNSYGARYNRVDLPCWGNAETHELGHNLGAVQDSAAHSNHNGHCTDEWDLMCYVDESGVPTAVVCSSTGNNRRYDCNNDDYFNTNPAPGSYLTTHWNIASHPGLAENDSTGTAGAGAYHSLTRPVRVVDTRLSPPGSIWGLPTPTGTDLPTHPASTTTRPSRLTPGRSYVSKITGFDVGAAGVAFPQQPLVSEAGVPNVGVGAVVLTVTVIGASSGGFLSIRPYDLDTFGKPQINSNINYAAGQVIPNTVTITVPAHGLIEVYASAGAPFVLFDVAGWFADASGTFVDKGAYHALAPTRIMNTRTGLGGSTKLAPNTTVNLKVTGANVDPTHAAAAVLNVTAAETTASSYFTVWPKGETRPNASNVNFPLGGAAANLVVVGVGTDGSISIYLESGTANVIVDLLGWFDGGGPGAPAGAVYRAITPTRLVDTRIAQQPKLAASETRPFILRGLGGIPGTAAVTAVIANIAAVAPTGGGYLAAFPTGGAVPDTSTVNFEMGQDRANLSFITLGSSGQSSVFASGAPTDVLVDVAGYFITA